MRGAKVVGAGQRRIGSVRGFRCAAGRGATGRSATSSTSRQVAAIFEGEKTISILRKGLVLPYFGALFSMKVYVDGKYYGERDAKVSVFDHGLLYGDGVFEGIRAYNGRVFKLK